MYLVIIIIINFAEDFNMSFLELRLELKSPELELESKLIVNSGIGIEITKLGLELNWKNGIDPNPDAFFSM